jgi:hypothetical protein
MKEPWKDPALGNKIERGYYIQNQKAKPAQQRKQKSLVRRKIGVKLPLQLRRSAAVRKTA